MFQFFKQKMIFILQNFVFEEKNVTFDFEVFVSEEVFALRLKFSNKRISKTDN